MKNIDTVIWDINGTLLDDLKCCIDTVNVLLRRRGMKTLDSANEYHAVFRFPVIDYYRAVGFDIGDDGSGYEPIAHEWMKEYLDREKDVGLAPGASEILSALKDAGVSQVLLSATERGMLLGQAERLGITGYFDAIIGTGDIYAYSKIDAARKWAENAELSGAVMIGDTPHDMETSQALGVPFIAVSWGHAAKEAFPPGVPVLGTAAELYRYLLIKQ